MGAAANLVLPPSLAAALHPGQMRRGRPADAVDNIEPGYVLTVRSEEDLVRVVNEARKAQLAMIPVGGGTRIHVGNIAAAFDIRLSLSGMASIIEHSPEDMVVTAEAGVSLSRLNLALAKHGQRICIDIAADDRSTLGGIVASNATGGYAYGFGTPRDLVLGMTVVDGHARSLRAGGKVVKNVSGYDLVRLFTGSFGSLGIIASVTMRTHPLPEHERWLEISFDTAADLDRLRAALFASHLPLACFDFERLPENGAWRMIGKLEGTRNEVDYQKTVLEQFAGRDSEHHGGASALHVKSKPTIALRITAAPTRVVPTAEELAAAIGSDRGAFTLGGRLGDGYLQITSEESDVHRGLNFVRTVTERAKECGARVVLERAPQEIKRILDIWGDRPGGFALMRRTKEAFDPAGILAPGRFVGGL